MQRVCILGATGSIGRSALDVLSRYPDAYRVHSLAAGRRVEELVQLCLRFRPKRVAIADPTLYRKLKDSLEAAGLQKVEAMAGSEALCELASDTEADSVLQAVVGAAGLAPSFAAARAGKRLMLANKESVVCGGQLLMRTVQENGCTLLPVDSEHNAIFQCLVGADALERCRVKLWLTCSGGPFRTRKDLDLSTVTPQMALSHPTWSMGRKISIDSATLMNKGFEVIEASHLFGVPADRICVVVHPQSVLHSMVEFSDGSVIGQMGPTDMRLPIAYSLAYPERISGLEKRLDFRTLNAMTFEAPDRERFPLLGYAFEALERGANASIVLNAANEVAVLAFLEERIRFTDIARTCRVLMDSMSGEAPATLEQILALDSEARLRAEAFVKTLV